MTITRSSTAAAALIAALAVLACLSGCRKAEDKSAGGPPQEAAVQPEQVPYYPGIIEEYRTVLAEDPHNLAALIALGNAYYDSGLWREAIRAYQRSLGLDPHNADVITDMGTSYRNLGDFDQAIREYERALRVEPVHLNALYNLGVVYGHDKHDYARAISYWDQLLHAAPKHPRAEQLQASIAQYRKALKEKGK